MNTVGEYNSNSSFAGFQIPPQYAHRSESPIPDDELMGAYLLSSMNKHTQTCGNCGTSQTPLWRKGWFDQLLNKHVMLCNACGLKYAKNQYCPYCKYVYKMNQDVHTHQEQWLNCTQCRRWVHSECEKKYNEMIGSQNCQGSQFYNNTPYMCIECKSEAKDKNVAIQQYHHQLSQTSHAMN
eukprot:TRINITY_DN20502_c0_g1_i1.p1 TRINITY_DN20502_c0_g1~~TRINITY_DN20502_c0_g1_i1.p1  ORF type:complete len:181 (+),score=18.32 TRINITY_DN20502_c0_g1_i1:62-604(+)